VVQLSGIGLQFIREACALARPVQPTLVVLEDIDLVAGSRSMRSGRLRRVGAVDHSTFTDRRRGRRAEYLGSNRT